jgi:hypothetical protein
LLSSHKQLFDIHTLLLDAHTQLSERSS